MYMSHTQGCSQAQLMRKVLQGVGAIAGNLDETDTFVDRCVGPQPCQRRFERHRTQQRLDSGVDPTRIANVVECTWLFSSVRYAGSCALCELGNPGVTCSGRAPTSNSSTRVAPVFLLYLHTQRRVDMCADRMTQANVTWRERAKITRTILVAHSETRRTAAANIKYANVRRCRAHRKLYCGCIFMNS